VGIKVFESLPVAMGEPTTGSQLTPKSWVAAVTVQRTTKTMTLYVNSGATYISTKGEMIGAGNDTTGTGTLDTPYASIQKAINMLPKYLEHDVTIIVCGMPHRYVWTPNGTDGICFASGSASTTIRVETPTGKNTVVSVSGKSVTITPKKDGDTINSICALINAHTSATTLMSAMGVGDTTTKMTTSLGTTSLVGGEVRIYDPVTVAGFSGTGSFIIRSDTDDAKWDRNLGTIISTATSNGVLFHNNNMRISLNDSGRESPML
jgi:hypothetical protein